MQTINSGYTIGAVIYLPMRDGVRLAMRIDRPAKHGIAVEDYDYIIVQVARRANGQSFGSRRGYNDRTRRK